MAANEITDQDLELDTAAGGQAAGKKRSILKIVLLVLTAVLLIAVSVAATYFLVKSGDDDQGFHLEDAVVDATVEGLGKGTKKRAKKAAKKGKTKASGPALYLPLDPPFTVNFESAGNVHYLQISMEVMARDSQVIEQAKQHLPLLRNNILMLLSDISYEEISSREAREKIRLDTLEVIRRSLRQETEYAKIEDVYFTSFVMQ